LNPSSSSLFRSSGSFSPAGLVLALGLAVTLPWFPVGHGTLAAQEPGESGGGSAIPCDVPMPWRVTELDERFGLTLEEAEDAIRLAGMVWEEAVGRRLVPQDERRGFPIRFLWDDRQEGTGERARRDRELAGAAAAIQDERLRVEALHRLLDEDRQRLESRLETFRQRQVAHRREVQRWNEQGGPPEEERRRLQAESDALEQERQALEREAEAINQRVALANRATGELNRQVEEHNRNQARVQALFPAQVIQSGTFRESRRTLAGRLISVEREIQVHQFDDREHLILVLAHELGHALGLGHTGVPGSVMADASGPGARDGPPGLSPSDLALFRSRCPALVPGG
jgi:hypothetical protein